MMKCLAALISVAILSVFLIFKNIEMHKDIYSLKNSIAELNRAKDNQNDYQKKLIDTVLENKKTSDKIQEGMNEILKNPVYNNVCSDADGLRKINERAYPAVNANKLR